LVGLIVPADWDCSIKHICW